MAGIVYLVWDQREDDHPNGPTIVRAAHASLEDAKTQAAEDLRWGRNVLRIEDENGNTLWEP